MDIAMCVFQSLPFAIENEKKTVKSAENNLHRDGH